MLYQIIDGTLSAGGETVLSHFQFEIRGTEKIALVGKNGAGKTTFLRLLAGETVLDRDDARKQPPIQSARKITVGMLEQNALQGKDGLVREELFGDTQQSVQKSEDAWSCRQEFERLFTKFGFSRRDLEKRLSDFSGGERTKIALLRLFLEEPDLLLLDEPTNHLDIETTQWLEEAIRSYEKAVVMVSHDRFFLDQTADVVYELAGKKLTRYGGNYRFFREEKQKRIQLQQKAYESQQQEIARLEALVERFKHKPNKAAFARSRKKMLERMTRIEKPDAEGPLLPVREFVPAVPGAKWVLELKDLEIGYDNPLCTITMRIRRGQKIGVIGPNGAGKSTFLKSIVGNIMPIAGTCTWGDRVEIGYFDQQTSLLSSEKSVVEYFQDQFPLLSQKEVRSILGAYLFGGKDGEKKVGQLSGGEKTRLVLAQMLQRCPNVLILDEPTNHMDIPAKEAIEAALRAYRGTLLFVSHDRYFTDQLAESLLIFEGNGSVSYYPFGYRHYAERIRRGGGEQTPPAQRSAKEQALVEGLKAVPKAEAHEERPMSPEEAYAEWQMGLAEEALQEQQRHVQHLLEKKSGELFWTDPEYAKHLEEACADAQQKWTECCLRWYDLWCDFYGESAQ